MKTFIHILWIALVFQFFPHRDSISLKNSSKTNNFESEWCQPDEYSNILTQTMNNQARVFVKELSTGEVKTNDAVHKMAITTNYIYFVTADDQGRENITREPLIGGSKEIVFQLKKDERFIFLNGFTNGSNLEKRISFAVDNPNDHQVHFYSLDEAGNLLDMLGRKLPPNQFTDYQSLCEYELHWFTITMGLIATGSSLTLPGQYEETYSMWSQKLGKWGFPKARFCFDLDQQALEVTFPPPSTGNADYTSKNVPTCPGS